MGRMLGLDVGTKTIGVAVSDPLGLIAHPLVTIARKGVAHDVEEILRIAREREAERVVVGLPYELDGNERRSARLARQIGEAVRDRGLPIVYIDERYSSVDAERRLREADVSRKRRKEVIDQAAAALILQSYLDHGDWTGAGE